MSSDFRLALLKCSSLSPCFDDTYARIFQVSSKKDLVRLLIEKEIDLIVLEETLYDKNQFQKIFQAYKIPYLCIGKKTDLINNKKLCVQFTTLGDLDHSLEVFSEKVLRFRTERLNQRMQYVLEKTTEFTEGVIHTTKDLFISETKNFFLNTLKMDRCHWVAVKANSSKLPPILKLKQELEKQKVDQGSLISILDSCSTELTSKREFQIWKTNDGDYLCMIWIHESENMSQCIVLNEVQMISRIKLESFLKAICPFLSRRWSLCQTVFDIQQQINCDTLTSLYNQRFLNEVVDRKIEEHKRYKTPFSILFIDVDHFKKVNDSLGHIVGSGVLRLVGDLLKGQIRTSDYAFRYGGDEFIILLSHTEGDDAVNVAERIRATIEANEFKLDGHNIRITVSIGISFFPTHADSAEEIIRIADEAMYYGKHKSRNIVYKAS